MKNVTICLVYFRSLGLQNLEAALYSVKRQDMTRVNSIVVVDNNTDDSIASIQAVIDKTDFRVPVCFSSFKHHDPTKTHAWSTNAAVERSDTSWVFFTRADYLLAFDAVETCVAAIRHENQFIVGGYYDVGLDVYRCEQTTWRTDGPVALRPHGREFDHVMIDSGVWLTTREVFNRVGGMDETMTVWGHAQTVFQHKIYQAGVEFTRVPSVVFYHTAHGYETPRDHSAATVQLQSMGLNIRELWARYDGPDNPYR